jgi:hypothetical protein
MGGAYEMYTDAIEQNDLMHVELVVFQYQINGLQNI